MLLLRRRLLLLLLPREVRDAQTHLHRAAAAGWFEAGGDWRGRHERAAEQAHLPAHHAAAVVKVASNGDVGRPQACLARLLLARLLQVRLRRLRLLPWRRRRRRLQRRRLQRRRLRRQLRRCGRLGPLDLGFSVNTLAIPAALRDALLIQLELPPALRVRMLRQL